MTKSMCTIAAALEEGARQLIDSESPLLDTRVLLGYALNKSRTYLMTWPERVLTLEQYQLFQQVLSRRQLGEPIAYIVGQREFWSLPFYVSPSTLIPRPDTEVLVEHALSYVKPSSEVLDLGTGTGAIAIALASEVSDARVTGVDVRRDAIELARRNSALNQVDVRWLESSWFTAVDEEKFHVIVSNPPYIDSADEHLVQGDVRFEPHSALIADEHGLADIKSIVEQAPVHLHSQGWLFIEHGFEQHNAVQDLFKQRGFQHVITHLDYGENPRVTQGQWIQEAPWKSC